MKVCDYCKMRDSDLAEKELMKNYPVNLGIIQGVTINTTIQDKDVLSVYLMTEYNDLLAEYNMKIKYCPMCGRKLSSEIDWENLTPQERNAYLGIYS